MWSTRMGFLDLILPERTRDGIYKPLYTSSCKGLAASQPGVAARIGGKGTEEDEGRNMCMDSADRHRDEYAGLPSPSP